MGHHVDHQVARAAAERHFAAGLSYYEDYPYIQRHPEMLPPLTSPERGWQAEVIPLSEAALVARIEAGRKYRSQTVRLFEDEARMAEMIRRQVAGTGGERLWRRRRDGRPGGR